MTLSVKRTTDGRRLVMCDGAETSYQIVAAGPAPWLTIDPPIDPDDRLRRTAMRL